MLINNKITILIEIYEESFLNYKKTIKLDFYKFDTIFDIKKKIQEKENINSASQTLMYNQNKLRDDETLEIYHIEKNEKFLLFFSSDYLAALIKIYVKTLLRETIDIYIYNTGTINELKRIIYSKLGIEENCQRIIFAGRQLEDDKTLQDYNIQKESTIYMISRLLNNYTYLIKIKIVFNKENMNLECEFDKYDNISIIKNKIKRLKNIDINNQLLFYKGRVANDNEKIMNIINAFPIYIKILSGKTIILYFNDGNTVNDINCTTEEALRIAFKNNDALSFIHCVETMFKDRVTYVVFRKTVVQYFCDNMMDIHGVKSTLYEDIARDVFEGVLDNNMISFCTDTYGVSLGKPLGEWP
jgi:ubiquitin C